jgi:hypothetical protein
MSMEKISKEVTRSKAVQMQCGWWLQSAWLNPVHWTRSWVRSPGCRF